MLRAATPRPTARRWATGSILGVLLASFVACVPADEGLPLGSAQFTITGRGSPRVLRDEGEGWTIHVDRFILSFKTMTIVNLKHSDQCSYRGRGAVTNVLFDGTEGSTVQAFNGIKPGACPDVGLRLGAPDDRTVLGEGGTLEDLVALASGTPALALFVATATRTGFTAGLPDERMRLSLRFDAARTSRSFGGCRDAISGAKIRPEARDAIFVSFAAEALFREAISPLAALRLRPFVEADRAGNNDQTITMEELDALPLSRFRTNASSYDLPSAVPSTSFGDWVRLQWRSSVSFGDGGGCNGLEPGTETDE